MAKFKRNSVGGVLTFLKIEIDILVSNVPALSVCNAKYIETTVILLTSAHWYATHYLSQNRIVSSAANQRMAFVIEH